MPIRSILAALIVALCWGGNYSATKFALMEFSPFLLLCLRFGGVALVLAPLALREKLPNLRDMGIIGLTLIVIQFACIFSGMHMGLSITSTIIATQLGVPFACIMAAIFFKDFLGPWRSFGLAIAFVGVVIVAGTPNAAQHWGAFLFVVLGALAWSSANLYLKSINAPSSVALLFWPSLMSLIAFLPLTLLLESGQLHAIREAALHGWMGILYGIFLSSIVGYGLWNWLITTHPVSQVMPYGLLMPIFGISFGAAIFGETMTLQILLGAAMTIAGVGIISLRRPRLAQIEC